MSLHYFHLALLGSVLSAWPRLAGAQTVKAQPATRPAPAAAQPVDTTLVYTYVEQMPQPPGGMEGLMQHLRKNLRYPTCLLLPSSSKVFVGFVVLADGRISNAHVEKSAGAGLDEEAVRVIRQMPPWTPGRQRGQAVKVAYRVPITFSF